MTAKRKEGSTGFFHITLAERINELVKCHGTFRGAAAAIGCDHAYLHRLASGLKANPSTDTLRRLGLVRIVVYRRAK